MLSTATGRKARYCMATRNSVSIFKMQGPAGLAGGAKYVRICFYISLLCCLHWVKYTWTTFCFSIHVLQPSYLGHFRVVRCFIQILFLQSNTNPFFTIPVCSLDFYHPVLVAILPWHAGPGTNMFMPSSIRRRGSVVWNFIACFILFTFKRITAFSCCLGLFAGTRGIILQSWTMFWLLWKIVKSWKYTRFKTFKYWSFHYSFSRKH